MMRNLKIIGVALVATLAMGTSVAQAALDETEFTPKGNVGTTVTGEIPATGIHEFTVGNKAIFCKKFHFESGLPGDDTEITIGLPKYEECTTTPVLGVSLPVTVTFNECFFELTGEKTNGLKYGISLDIKCEGAEDIVFHVKSGTKDVCTLTMGPQTITGMWATNGAGVPDDVVIHSDENTIVKTTIHGSLCGGTEETNKEFDAIFESTTTLTGSQGGEPVDLTVSHRVV